MRRLPVYRAQPEGGLASVVGARAEPVARCREHARIVGRDLLPQSAL